jgi:hypothetical protein
VPRRTRDSLWFGAASIALSVGIGAFGYSKAVGSFTPTTGIITSIDIGTFGGRTGGGSQRVIYRYTVAGEEYAGQSLAPSGGTAGASLRIGGTIPVYFATETPALSHAFSPPRPWMWVVGAALFATIGLVAIVAGWPH